MTSLFCCCSFALFLFFLLVIGQTQIHLKPILHFASDADIAIAPRSVCTQVPFKYHDDDTHLM